MCRLKDWSNPFQFEGLDQLQSLNLSHNLLDRVPAIFSNLPHLRVLDLSHNRYGVPAIFSNLPHLRVLDLSNKSYYYYPLFTAEGLFTDFFYHIITMLIDCLWNLIKYSGVYMIKQYS